MQLILVAIIIHHTYCNDYNIAINSACDNCERSGLITRKKNLISFYLPGHVDPGVKTKRIMTKSREKHKEVYNADLFECCVKMQF